MDHGAPFALGWIGGDVGLTFGAVIQVLEGFEAKALVLGRIGQRDNLRFKVFAPGPATVRRARNRAAVVLFHGFAGG